MNLNQGQIQQLIQAVGMRMCWIETRTATLRAADVQQMGDAAAECLRREGGMIRSLDSSQMQLLLELEALRTTLYAAFERALA